MLSLYLSRRTSSSSVVFGRKLFAIVTSKTRARLARAASSAYLAISFPEPTCLLVSTKTRSLGIINKRTSSFPEPSCLLLLKFDTAVLSKRNLDFPSFSSAYWMPLWNVATSTLYLDATQTKPRMRRETGIPRILVSGTELKNDCACHQFARENWGWQGETIVTCKWNGGIFEKMKSAEGFCFG